MKAVLVVTVVAILAFDSSPANAGEAQQLLYDVDFGSPPHTVGEPPVTGAEDPPRGTPTGISFGDPTVVEALGLLTDQPCAFGNRTTGYDQLEFAMPDHARDGFPESYDIYHLKMDVLIERLTGSDFVLLLDIPHVHNIYFNADGTMTTFPSGLNSTFEFGVPLLLEVTYDIPGDNWTIRVDGEVIYSDDHAGTVFRSFRVNLTGEHIDDAVALDNIQVWGENRPVLHVCCVGEECFLTDYDGCDAMGGEYHPELDECEPQEPCLDPTPVRSTSWGGLKAVYR